MNPYPFEVWRLVDGEPHRIAKYATRADAEKAMSKWPDYDCWIEEAA